MERAPDMVVLRSTLLWLCRIVLGVYCILMLSSYWSLLSDVDTTVRLVGSDVGCSLSAIECNWLIFGVDKVFGMAVIVLAGVAQFATRWRHRDRASIMAALAAVAHLSILRVLLNPS
jgi:hypothetical protein